MARHQLIRALGLAALGSSCVTNSPGNYRGVALDAASPVFEFQERLPQPGRDLELEREALWHLEDLVEDSASRLCRQAVDFPTPTIIEPLGTIEILDRLPESPEDARLEGYFGARYFGIDLLGLKYLVDHLGPRFADVTDDAPAQAIGETVGKFLAGEIAREEALLQIRASEAALCKDLGLAEADLADMERRYDSAVGILYAFTRLEGRKPRISVCVPTMTLDPRNLVHVFAHELMHCITLSSHPIHPALAFADPRNQQAEIQALQELTCDTFADLVLLDLTERGLVPPETRGVRSVGIPEQERREQNRLVLNERLGRLRSLYRDPAVSFGAVEELAERYGEVNGEVDPGEVSRWIAGCIRSLGAEAFARRIWTLTGFRDLERLYAECSGPEEGTLMVATK